MADAERGDGFQSRPLRRREYEGLVELGRFEDERLELLAGAMICKDPQGAAHAEVTRRIARSLERGLGERAQVRVHCPFALSDESEPEPDVAVVPPGSYLRDHPTQAFLLVEVADSSLRRDRELKAVLYARASVPEYWLVDLVGRAVEVHRQPRGVGYIERTSVGEGGVLSPASFPEVELPVAEVLAE